MYINCCFALVDRTPKGLLSNKKLNEVVKAANARSTSVQLFSMIHCTTPTCRVIRDSHMPKNRAIIKQSYHKKVAAAKQLLRNVETDDSESLRLLERLGDALQDYELAQEQLSTANRSLYIQRDNSTTDVEKIKFLRCKHRKLLRAGELHSDDLTLQYGQTLGEDLGTVQFSELGDVTRTSLSGSESVVFSTSLQRGNRSIGHKLANAARVVTFQKPQPVKGLSACTECAMKVNQYGSVIVREGKTVLYTLHTKKWYERLHMQVQRKMNRLDEENYMSHYIFQRVVKGVAVDKHERGISSQWQSYILALTAAVAAIEKQQVAVTAHRGVLTEVLLYKAVVIIAVVAPQPHCYQSVHHDNC
eukprot:8573-Heterococcus_DN1.PRE.2